MINKRKTLKILGVGALCLATVLGVAGCGNTLDKVGDKSVLLTASEAMEIQKTAMTNYYTAINKADGTIEIINTSCDTDTGKNEVSKTYVGMVDGKKTSIEYTNNDSYRICHVIDADNFTYYRKEDKDFWKSDKEIGFIDQASGGVIIAPEDIEEGLVPMDSFYQGYKNEDGSYVLQYRIVDIDRESDWTEDKYYTSIYNVEINIDKDMQMQTMIVTHTTTFSSTLTNEEIEAVKGNHAGPWNSTGSTKYNYNYTGFSEEWVKGLMQEVDNNVAE